MWKKKIQKFPPLKNNQKLLGKKIILKKKKKREKKMKLRRVGLGSQQREKKGDRERNEKGISVAWARSSLILRPGSFQCQ